MTDHVARFVKEVNDEVLCSLCPRCCVIPSGNFGSCGVRGNKNGRALIPFYGQLTALAMDPIEKKPLYHFRPGSMILSAGFSGCNLHCPFCQNWRISQSAGKASPEIARETKPGDIVSTALRGNVSAIAYTYSEPLVHMEFLLDCMTLAHRHGIANVLVTNGCVNAGAAKEIIALTDAANIDLKCFSGNSYTQILGADSGEKYLSTANFLETVLAFIRLAHAENVHVEITTLVVPGFNDSAEELDKCIDFIAEIQVPWHLSAYHPDYRWNAPPTDPQFLLETKKRAEKKIKYVYVGNISVEENNTFCHHCNAILIRRRGYRINTASLAPPLEGERFFRCANCGETTPIIRSV